MRDSALLLARRDAGQRVENLRRGSRRVGDGNIAQRLQRIGLVLRRLGGDAVADGANADSVILVGTRVQGDTMPRPIQIVSEPPSPPSFTTLEQGYSVVGVVFHVAANGDLTRTWIGER